MAKKKNVHAVYWRGVPPKVCDIDDTPITDLFYDAKTTGGSWGCLCEGCFKKHTFGALGLGIGQKYEKQPDGRWLKMGG